MLADGIEEFRKHIDPATVGGLLAATSRWVDPETFKLLPVWHPYTARKAPLYSEGWTRPATNKGEPKYEGNVAANKTLTESLGLAAAHRTNWTCCHIWGNDDATFQSSQSEVNDRRYFTCPANMILVPTPLKAFTDSVPEVKAAIRYAARLLYDFWPEGRPEPNALEAGAYLPSAWLGRDHFPNVVPLGPRIMSWARSRYENLKSLMQTRPGHFPYAETAEAIRYWQARQPASLLNQIDL